MKTDIEIAREAQLKPIAEIANGLGIEKEYLEPYGKYIAKVPYTLIDHEKVKRSKLILVTAITPTKAGIGKTTVSVGLGLGMNRIGKKTVVALREPSLGPCFGQKGGAAGGGYAQVVPMCSMGLMPTELEHAYDARDAALLEKLNVNLCMNCGACTYVCPARRSLSEKNQLAKLFLRENKG